MGILGEKLASALDAKSNDINSFVWKGPKVEENGVKVQKQIKLVDADNTQLTEFYKHCMSMLYSPDKINPGRYVLKDIVKEQINKCNTELYLRWLENKYIPSTRSVYPRYLVFQDLKEFLDKNSEAIPKENWKTTKVDNAPEEFRDVTIENVLDGCLDTLGTFDKRHLSLNFITKLGVWFTPEELKDLTVKDEETGKTKDRIKVIIERLRLKPNTQIKINNRGLSYSELRSMLTLKVKKYSDLTTDQLVTLRNKVLFRFENEIDYHISQWEERIKQIEMVANSKGFSVITPAEKNEE
jgi:hypothetical protein